MEKKDTIHYSVTVHTRIDEAYGVWGHKDQIEKVVRGQIGQASEILSLEQLQNWIGGAQEAVVAACAVAGRDAFNALYLQQQGKMINQMHEEGRLYPQGVPDDEPPPPADTVPFPSKDVDGEPDPAEDVDKGTEST